MRLAMALFLVPMLLGCQQVPSNSATTTATPASAGVPTPQHLTKGAVENAIKNLTLDGRPIRYTQLVVKGVIENSADNTATADLQLSGFEYTSPAFTGNQAPRTYNGPGTAHFVHYSDGTWALKIFRITREGDFGGGKTWQIN